AGIGLVTAAVVHSLVAPQHFRVSLAYGLFFVAVTITQALFALILFRRPDGRTVRWVALSSAALVLLWLMSRTTGLPVGPEPWRTESFGAFDVLASVAE